jgi:glycosyltransferase involved in cell wall biosynthesis
MLLLCGDRRNCLDGGAHRQHRYHGNYRYCVDGEQKELGVAAAPEISVILPARNEGAALASSIQSIARARAGSRRLEFIVVDDASTDDSIGNLTAALPELLEEPNIEIWVSSMGEHSGVYRTRNSGAEQARADVLFMTDAHVKFSPGWDDLVLDHLRPNRVLCGTTTEEGTEFRGYGCQLLVPFMGSRWNDEPSTELAPIQIAPCHATVLSRALFERLGGYDPGMLYYGGGEPEFSLRAWLHGAEIRQLKALEVQHQFRPDDQLTEFLTAMRRFTVHNRLRFGLLYLSEDGCMQLLSYYARAFPAFFQRAMGMLTVSDVWERREFLDSRRVRQFDWFVDRFELRNQIGGEVI